MSNEITNREKSAQDKAQAMLPPVSVIEDSSGITLVADLPGVPKDKLEVRIDGDSLVVEGALGLAMPEGMTASRADVTVPRYRRRFMLSSELDSSKITADHRDGVLRLRIPKAQHAQPRTIAINVP